MIGMPKGESTNARCEVFINVAQISELAPPIQMRLPCDMVGAGSSWLSSPLRGRWRKAAHDLGGVGDACGSHGEPAHA